MAKVEQNLRRMWTDAYRFFEKYHGQPPTEEVLEACSEEIRTLFTAHGEHPMMTELLFAAWGELDREWAEYVRKQEKANGAA